MNPIIYEKGKSVPIISVVMFDKKSEFLRDYCY